MTEITCASIICFLLTGANLKTWMENWRDYSWPEGTGPNFECVYARQTFSTELACEWCNKLTITYLVFHPFNSSNYFSKKPHLFLGIYATIRRRMNFCNFWLAWYYLDSSSNGRANKYTIQQLKPHYLVLRN